MYGLKIILLYVFASIVNLFGESDKIVIDKLDLIGNENISLNEILFIVRQRPQLFFIDNLNLMQDY